MAFPIKTCVICEEEFELRPDKPGFANRCPSCSTPEAEEERANRLAGFVKRPAPFPSDLRRRDMVASAFPLRPFVASFKQGLERE